MIAKKSILLLKKFEIVLSEIETVKKKNKLELRTANSLSDEAAEKVVDIVKKKNECSTTVALLLISGVVQRGGTNKSAGSNKSFTCGELTLNAQELQAAVSSVSNKGTNRQLARALCNEIYQVALAANIEGDLANQMRYYHPDLTTTEAV